MFNRLKIGTKILFVTVGMLLVVIVVVSLVSDLSARNALEQDTFSRLTAVREMKAQQVEDYIQEIRNQIVTFSENNTIVHAMKDLGTAYRNANQDVIDEGQRDTGALDKRLKAYYRKEFLAIYE